MQATRMLNHAASAQPHRVAVHCNGRHRTWSEIAARVPRMAGALKALGLGNGAFVSVLALNSDRYAELFYAVPWAGGALSPLNVRWSVAENAVALTATGATILFADETFAADAFALQARVPSLKTLIYLGEGEAPPGMLSYEALLDNHDACADADRRDDDLYVVFYTGGTTGHPKGVTLSHRAIVLHTYGYLAMLPSTEGISHLHTGGFFHFSGASPLWYTTMAAGTQVVLPKFEPVAVMKAIDEFRVSNTVLVPTMVNMLMNHLEFENFDLSSLRTCIYGAAPMPETLILRTMEKLPTWQFYQIYGMTESGGYATMLRWTDHLPSSGPASKLRSCGRPAPGFEVRIVLPDGSLAPVGKIGEIVLRSDILMDGYLGDAAATAAAIRDGWLYSGDAGYLDEDGFLYVADRIKDMIVTGGENVYSVEVERALYQHPAISEAAVIGLPSEKWGETVHAVVVLRAGTSATEQEVIAHCRELIGGYKCPRSVDVRSQPLPVTPVGKIRKNVLRDECLGRGDVSSSAA